MIVTVSFQFHDYQTKIATVDTSKLSVDNRFHQEFKKIELEDHLTIEGSEFMPEAEDFWINDFATTLPAEKTAVVRVQF